MAALWRQDRPLDPEFQRFNRCLEEDWFLLPFELRLQLAHARTLTAAGILTEAEGASIESALEAMRTDYEGQPCPPSDAEDLHTWVESSLVERVGDAGKKIHTARSRNDQVATLLVLFLLDRAHHLERELRGLVTILAERAITWRSVPMLARTHTRFAAPGSAGFWALRYATAFRRAAMRAASLRELWSLECPLGSGAVAGSSIAIDRRLQARELGFREPSWNALDATGSRDECLEYLSLASNLALHIQSFATDVIDFAADELGWIRYPAEFATGSSMMPNKSNPDALELLRGSCAKVESASIQAVLLLKGLPSGYNRDLQCIKPLVSETASSLEAACALVARFVRAMELDPERMAASFVGTDADATLRMEALVREGLPLREAHHRIAAEVARKRGGNDPERVAHAAAVDSPQSKTTDYWEQLITTYSTEGGASPVEVQRVAERLVEWGSAPPVD